MRKFRVVGMRFVLFGIAWAAVMGLVVFGLWNALMQVVFGLRAISFWQALGLFFLSRVLFGGFGSRGMRKTRFARGWRDLTPEQRQRFREAMGARCAERFGEGEAAKAS